MLPRWPGDNGGYNPLLRRTGLSAAMGGLQAMEPPTVTLPGAGSTQRVEQVQQLMLCGSPFEVAAAASDKLPTATRPR